MVSGRSPCASSRTSTTTESGADLLRARATPPLPSSLRAKLPSQRVSTRRGVGFPPNTFFTRDQAREPALRGITTLTSLQVLVHAYAGALETCGIAAPSSAR